MLFHSSIYCIERNLFTAKNQTLWYYHSIFSACTVDITSSIQMESTAHIQIYILTIE